MGRRALNAIIAIEAVAIVCLIALIVPVAPWKEIDYWVQRYQALIVGLLALGGGVFVLVAAKWQVKEIRFIADREVQERRRFARMQVVSLLAEFCRGCDQIVADIDNWQRTDGELGKNHMRLPVFAIPASLTGIALLPQAECLFRFARSIDHINEAAAFLFDVTSSPDETMKLVRRRAASSALQAYEWYNDVGAAIPWSPMDLSEGRIDELRQIASEAEG